MLAVAVDPFLLRSAVYAILAADTRFNVVLCPLGEDPAEFARATEASVLLTSTPVEADVPAVVLRKKVST